MSLLNEQNMKDIIQEYTNVKTGSGFWEGFIHGFTNSFDGGLDVLTGVTTGDF
jgi:hypothetical protein